jgi:hypothetical protein
MCNLTYTNRFSTFDVYILKLNVLDYSPLSSILSEHNREKMYSVESGQMFLAICILLTKKIELHNKYKYFSTEKYLNLKIIMHMK